MKGKAGSYLIRVEARHAPAMQEFPAVKDRILHVLSQQKRQAVLQEWIAAEKRAARIEILDPSLQAGQAGRA